MILGDSHAVALQAGCAAHLYLPDFVAAEQIDAGEDWVSYRLPDGTGWRDGAPAAGAMGAAA